MEVKRGLYSHPAPSSCLFESTYLPQNISPRKKPLSYRPYPVKPFLICLHLKRRSLPMPTITPFPKSASPEPVEGRCPKYTPSTNRSAISQIRTSTSLGLTDVGLDKLMQQASFTLPISSKSPLPKSCLNLLNFVNVRGHFWQKYGFFTPCAKITLKRQIIECI